MTSIFSGLITSKTRIKILMRLFLNPRQSVYLRGLANEFNISPSQVKDELDQLRKAKLLISNKEGRQVFFSANREHTLFNELHSMVKKALGIDQVIDGIVQRLSDLERAYLIDDYAAGKDTGIIDIVLVGNVDQYHLNDLSRKTERYIKRKVRSLVITREEYQKLQPNLQKRPTILILGTADTTKQ